MLHKPLSKLAIAGCLAGASLSVQAIDYKFNGYISLYAGKAFDGEEKPFIVDYSADYGSTLALADCPCFIADWLNAGVYEDDKVMLEPDSRAGFQIKTFFTNQLSFTLQAAVSGAELSNPRADFAYFRYELNDNFSIDLGRKALPLYYYSDFQNIGFAFDWVRVPGGVYGWAINNYNGVSLNYGNDLGDGSISVNLWYGSEKTNDVPQYTDIYYGLDSEIEWKDMLGLAVEYNYDWLTLRAVAMENKATETIDYAKFGDIKYADPDNAKQSFYGFAFLAEHDNWRFISEINRFEIPDTDYESEGLSASLGYKVGDFTPTLSYSSFEDNYFDTEFRTQSFTLRWDASKGTAVKFQYDRFMDDSGWDFTGDSKLVTLGVDYVY